MRLEIPLTVLSLVLMGGNMFLPWASAHEIIGVLLMVLWAVHVYANRRWYKAIFCGKYKAFRVIQTVVNCGVLICAVFLAISGVILSNHVFAFLEIESGASFARTAHLLASHWYFVFIALHIGLHVNVIFNRLGLARLVVAIRVVVGLISAYGIYVFFERGLWKYLTLQQPFFFLNLERGYVLFFADYIAMVVALAAAMHYAILVLNLLFRDNSSR